MASVSSASLRASRSAASIPSDVRASRTSSSASETSCNCCSSAGAVGGAPLDRLPKRLFRLRYRLLERVSHRCVVRELRLELGLTCRRCQRRRLAVGGRALLGFAQLFFETVAGRLDESQFVHQLRPLLGELRDGVG